MVSESLAQDTQLLKYLALGDSYTIGESVAEKDRWPNQLAFVLSKQIGRELLPTIIATTGWRTDNLINAIAIARLKEEYDWVSLLIGVNNQYQNRSVDEYAREFEELLKTSIRLAKHRNENVFVVSIPDYGFTPYGRENQEKISKAIDQFNEVNKRLSDQYQVCYVNITPISRQGLNDPELVAADGLHPSGKMYEEWVQQIRRQITLK